MEYLTTATGRQVACDYFNPDQPVPQVDIEVRGLTIVEAAALFSDSRETKQMWFGVQYISNYTHLVAVIPSGGSIRIVMRKE